MHGRTASIKLRAKPGSATGPRHAGAARAHKFRESASGRDAPLDRRREAQTNNCGSDAGARTTAATGYATRARGYGTTQHRGAGRHGARPGGELKGLSPGRAHDKRRQATVSGRRVDGRALRVPQAPRRGPESGASVRHAHRLLGARLRRATEDAPDLRLLAGVQDLGARLPGPHGSV